MNVEYKLDFQGPYPFCAEEKNLLDGCPYAFDEGVYLWAVELKNGHYRVSYVGETGKGFFERTREHLIHIMGGNYRIWDPDEMRKGECKIVWNGLWQKERRNKTPEFLAQYESLAKTIKQYILIHQLFVAPIQVDRRTRRWIEAMLVTAIRNDPAASTLLPDDIRYIKPSLDKGKITIQISTPKVIEGVPKKIAV